MITRRIRYWLQSRDRARLLREEMYAHLVMKAEELMEKGMSEADARAEAHRQFGNVTRTTEDSRSIWIACWITDFAQDSAHAVRTLRKQPGFTAAAVLSASLGIGACSMIFGLANFALFRPLPVAGAGTLLSITGRSLRGGEAGNMLAYPDYLDLKQARSLEDVAAFFPLVPAAVAARSGVEPQRYWGSLATANYFDVVRPHFLLGRGFDASRDDRRGERPVIVLSHHLWQSRFGSDPNIVGRLIEFNDRNVTVVGVAGPGFRGTEVGLLCDFWVPFSMVDELHLFTASKDPLHDRAGLWVMVAARLRRKFTQRDAAAELDVIARRLTAAYPATNADRGFHAEPAGQVSPSLRTLVVLFFVLLISVSVLVLLTACANVANLLLARASARQKEIATRLAIGAGRGRVVRQLLTESLLLALLGGAGGFFLARLGTSSLDRFQLPIAFPVDLAISLDYRVVLFSVVLSVLTGMMFGLVPALRATRPDLTGALKSEPVRLGRLRWFSLRNALVISQITICMVLLVCSTLFLRSLRAARLLDLGIRSRNLLLMNFDPALSGRTETANTRLLENILERAASIPGVESGSLATNVPLSPMGDQTMLSGDTPAGEKRPDVNVDVYSVSRGFFDTLGVPFVAGEDFRPGVPAEGVAIINRAAAEHAFPDQNPIGRRATYEGHVVRIVGVVSTTKSRTIAEDPRPCIYLPILRNFAEIIRLRA